MVLVQGPCLDNQVVMRPMLRQPSQTAAGARAQVRSRAAPLDLAENLLPDGSCAINRFQLKAKRSEQTTVFQNGAVCARSGRAFARACPPPLESQAVSLPTYSLGVAQSRSNSASPRCPSRPM